MRRIAGLIVLMASVAALGTLWPSAAAAQRGRPPGAGRAVPRPPVRPGAVVFIGGYFYDPFFGPYPWWPQSAYPYPYYPILDDRVVVRVIATPKDAAVYVDGFYAGIVHDFNDWFQGLPLPPGGHDIVLFLDGYRTIHRRLYLAAGSTFKLRETMERLPPGVVSEPPTIAPELPPPPPVGSFVLPRTPPRPAPPAMPPPAMVRGGEAGIMTLRVQPANADVWIDGERWASSDAGRFVLQLPTGAHHVEVRCVGYHAYSDDILVGDGQTLHLNVSLSPDGRR